MRLPMILSTLSVLPVLALLASLAMAQDYPAPAPPADTSQYGQHFQRTMTLIETSTPEHRNTVRILFYGQSITGANWHPMVADYLRQTYPNVDFVIENRALGGFSSQRLVRTMWYDLMPFYPDLLVFHVYGSHSDYEEIIRQVRRHTTAEIIMQTDHLGAKDSLELTVKSGDNAWTQPGSWGDKMNLWFLPEYAQRYGCSLQPQRTEWAQYLKDNNLQPQALLKDGVHPNEHGKWLMATLLNRYMVYRPDAPTDEWENLVKTYVVGQDVQWDGDTLTLEFEGNRVVALAGTGEPGAAEVLIDGKSPAEFPECYSFTRPSGTPGVGWPTIKRITWQTPPIIETWTAECTDFNEDRTAFRFTVTGSVTGPDGSGTVGPDAETFVSDSGRIVIEPADWVFAYDLQVGGKKPLESWKTTWKVEPLFVETYRPAPVTDPTREHLTVLAQGLPNGRHTLTLKATDGQKPAIGAIRVYCPPLRD